MRYYVNENCIGCGMCEGICPAVFQMTAAGVAEASEFDVSSADEEAAEQAMNGCPVGAIEPAE